MQLYYNFKTSYFSMKCAGKMSKTYFIQKNMIFQCKLCRKYNGNVYNLYK